MANCCIKYSHEIAKTMFGVPKNDIEREKWEEALEMTLKKSYRVCASHFNNSDIITTWESGTGLNKYTVMKYFLSELWFNICQICLKVPKLINGAIPLANCKDDSYQIETKRKKVPNICIYT